MGYRKNGRLIVSIALLIVALFAIYWFLFCDMGRLPRGDLIAEYPSPTGQYSIKIYKCSGNATTADSIRGELVEGNRKKNIYWEYKETDANVFWVSEYEVRINGIPLDVRKDTYDWRRER